MDGAMGPAQKRDRALLGPEDLLSLAGAGARKQAPTALWRLRYLLRCFYLHYYASATHCQPPPGRRRVTLRRNGLYPNHPAAGAQHPNGASADLEKKSRCYGCSKVSIVP